MSRASHQVAERRLKVSELRLAGDRNQRQIAAKLGVGVATINRDFQALDEEYRLVAAQNVKAAKGQDLERIEELIKGLWPAGQTGDTDAGHLIVKLLERRAKLLGLDAPPDDGSEAAVHAQVTILLPDNGRGDRS